MDFDALLSAYKSKTCIMSVEVFPDGNYGNIRIVTGNQAHYDDMLNTLHRPFVPGSPYEYYFPQNKNFEDYCYRCAVLGQPLHSYVSLPQMDLWLNMILLPLSSDKENIGYCIYSYDVTPYPDSERRASLSADTSSAVLQTCLKLRDSGDYMKKFCGVIEDIRQICDSDDCGILLVDEQTEKCDLLGDAIKPESNLLPFENYLDENTYAMTRTWKDTIGDSTCVIISDKQDMNWLGTVNPIWHASLTSAGVKSIVLFPLNYNNKALGYMWATNFNVENTVKIKETLELATFFIASEISNHLLLQKLELMSSTDMLTGAKNRNSMNAVVGDILSGKICYKYPYSVIYADLNRLKWVNDTKGHEAGDMLLKTAVSILQKTFPEGDVFRVGGDEFVVLASGLCDTELHSRIKSLYAQAEKEEHLLFAVGASVVSQGDDILAAMHVADERMYANKREYYKAHPDKKYR